MQYETIRAAICDDEEFFRNELKNFVSEYGNEMDINVSIDLYDNAKELMNNIFSKSKEYDLLFLDVEMPGMTGIEMADALRKIDPWVCISFVTSYDAFAIQAFRLDALDYVMKPIKYTQVKHIIEKARIQIDYRKNAQKAEKRYLKIKSGYEDVLIDLQNVIYIEKRRNQCVFHKRNEEIYCYEPLKNVYESGELSEDATCANFAQVADNGKTYHYKFYSLPAIIAVGYRINSGRATQFRQWATKVLDTFTKQGYVLDKSRLINGQIFDEDYFDHLISEIQEIRASERRFYQKITDIYATAVDYSLNSQTTKDFFATVQNKMHYAVHGGTAAEVIMARADHTKEHMGLTSWKNAPDGKIVKADVSVAKNYLSMDEMQELNEIVTMYLDYATRQARRHIPMTMADWASKLDAFLQFNDAEILQNKGKVTAAIAKAFAESEFEQYRVIQDRLYQSDFDRLVASTEQKD